MPRKKLRTDALRDALLAEALTLLERGGATAVTARAVAAAAGTSPPAVYELFGNKSGLARAMYFEGFERLHENLSAAHLASAGADEHEAVEALRATWWTIRTFSRKHPALTQLMFARSFSEFEPSPEDLRAADATRRHIVARVADVVDVGVLVGRPKDLAHVYLALAQGLALQEAAGWLGRSSSSVKRKWELGFDAFLGRQGA